MASKDLPLPHLKPDELADRDHEELVLSRKLSTCWRGDDFDIERAFQIMNGAAELIFDVMYKAHSVKPTYKATWIPQIISDAVYRTIVVSEHHITYGVPRDHQSEVASMLEKTLRDHVRELTVPNQPTPEPNPDDWLKETKSLPASVQVPSSPNFAAELERLLAEAKWTPEQADEKVGISCRTIYRHLAGEIPSRRTVWAYEEALSKRLNRKVSLPVPVKRQNASKKSVEDQ